MADFPFVVLAMELGLSKAEALRLASFLRLTLVAVAGLVLGLREVKLVELLLVAKWA